MNHKQRLQAAFHPADFMQTGSQLVQVLGEDLGALLARKTERVIPYLSAPLLQEAGLSSELEEPMTLFQSVLDHSIRLHHPRYVGHQISPPLPLVSLAGLLTDQLNNGMGVYEMGMAGTIMERYVIDWTAEQFGLGEGSSGFLTSGGTLANLTALLAARQAKSAHDIWQEGYAEGKKYAVMVSAEAHYCIARAVKIMGWGEEGIISVPIDKDFRLDPSQLAAGLALAKERGREVLAVIGCSCSTATGSFDPLEAIADFCEEHDLWFHVDAAHGGPAVFSPKYRSLLAGCERADSIVMDYHKMALCPALCTALLFRNGKDSYRTFAQKASYLWEDPAEMEWHNLARRTFECTKSMMSLRPYVLLKQYGPEILSAYLETVFDLAKTFADRIRRHDSFELLMEPEANIVCFRFVKGIKAEQQNELNGKIRQAIVEAGHFYLVQTTVGEQLYLRTALMNPFTNEADLAALLKLVRELGEQLK